MANLAKVKVNRFQTGPRPYTINTLFMFEGKIPNDSKVIAFTRNHTDNTDEDDDDDRTK